MPSNELTDSELTRPTAAQHQAARPRIEAQIATELGVRPSQVRAAADLLDSGATVPFIARYRKEATDGLDDAQLRQLEVRLTYLRELADRRQSILDSISGQGRLTADLQAAIDAAETKQALEDLYLPYKPRRRTKGQMAREAGLEPLADRLLGDPGLDPQTEAQAFVRPAVPPEPGPVSGSEPGDYSTVSLVLDGVRDLLAERWAENAALVQELREWLWTEGMLCSSLVSGQSPESPEAAKFRDYFDYEEPIHRVPSHRALAVLRGRALSVLDVRLSPPELPAVDTAPAGMRQAPSLAELRIARHLQWQHSGRPSDDLIRRCVAWTWRVKLSLSTERDLLARLRDSAETVAIRVFADNLRDLLLAAPAGPRVVMGLDPGIRTGVKVAVVDVTGRVVDTATVYPHEPRRDWEGAWRVLVGLCERHGVELIAIGNGTASRETDRLAGEVLRTLNAREGQPTRQKVVVSEAGASVYSASEFASQELPDLDVSLRGAVSIARRLQDPLAELVKIEPKAIGVGQYQHDINQGELARTLDTVVEDCVNKVGVDLNTASVALLSRVSGLSPAVARAVVRWRDSQGAFRNRQQLLDVTGLGQRTFEQCAGFLRIRGGDNPLDMTAVHPETYPVVQRILSHTGRPVHDLMGRADMLRTLRPELFANEQFGVITVRDILSELEKPGRDPRPEFQAARLAEGVEAVTDLRSGMVLEGTVTNVAAFGAFVDVGVHQDGLVHISQISRQFVQNPHDVVKAGDVVRVRVLEVDLARQRISLTMRLDEDSSRGNAPAAGVTGTRFEPARTGSRGRSPTPAAPTTMASAFERLRQR